jgi:3-isopropylmalate/(R)-2-methylmalate dehydratase small subunit
MNPQTTSVVAPIDRADVDTDAILPKQFLRSIEKTGYGDYLFDEWRYLDHGELGQHEARPLNPKFTLNQPRYQGTQILLCRRNFGSGSAREHAVWALRDFGIQILIAPSYGDIFANNCYKNGVLPIMLAEKHVDALFAEVREHDGYQLTVDLARQTVTTPAGDIFSFSIDAFRKRCLLEKLDEISYALARTDKIREFEARRRQEAPWIFNQLSE